MYILNLTKLLINDMNLLGKKVINTNILILLYKHNIEENQKYTYVKLQRLQRTSIRSHADL